MVDLMRLSPAPWECENVSQCSERSGYAKVTNEAGKVLFDTLNSDVAEIYTEHETDGTTYSDLQGKADLSFAALARNAFEVMIRGKVKGYLIACWVFAGFSMNHNQMKSLAAHLISLGEIDPFTALIEANAWYRANVESKPE